MDLTRLLALLAFVGAAVPASPAVAACEVHVSSNAFTPSAKTVPVGATVEWCWDEGSHTVTFDDGPNSGVRTAGAKYPRTFDSAGSFGYQCTIHPSSMRGTVTVQAPASTKPASPTAKPTTRPPTTAPATTRPPTTPPVTRTPTPTTAPTTVAPTTTPPTTPPTTAPATPTTSPAALDIDPAPAKPKTGLAIAIGLVVAAGAFGTVGWLLLKGRSG